MNGLLGGDTDSVVASSPRYDPRILEAIVELDDPTESLAETCRRVGARATELGLPRPSLVHLRTLVKAHRLGEELVAARRAIAKQAAWELSVGRFVHPYELADELIDPLRKG